MRTNYPDRQIRKFLNDENTKKEITATCALCIGLKLIPPFSEDLVGKAGHRWAITEEEYYYQRILKYQYKDSLEKINAHLIELGCRPWGGRSTGK